MASRDTHLAFGQTVDVLKIHEMSYVSRTLAPGEHIISRARLHWKIYWLSFVLLALAVEPLVGLVTKNMDTCSFPFGCVALRRTDFSPATDNATFYDGNSVHEWPGDQETVAFSACTPRSVVCRTCSHLMWTGVLSACSDRNDPRPIAAKASRLFATSPPRMRSSPRYRQKSGGGRHPLAVVASVAKQS